MPEHVIKSAIDAFQRELAIYLQLTNNQPRPGTIEGMCRELKAKVLVQPSMINIPCEV